MTTTPNILYHYTTAQGLMGILKTNVLWASNLNYMNDFSELKYSTSLIHNEFGEFLKSSSGDLSMSHLPEVFADFFAKIEGRYSVYACCFCEEEDELSQWRAYANKGTGYSIGFDAKQLEQPRDKPPYSLILSEVIYDSDLQSEIIKTSVKEFVNKIKNNEIAVDLFRNFLAVVFGSACAFKNPAFSKEKEWRAIALNLTASDINNLNFREIQGIVVPYIEMKFPSLEMEKEDHLPIIEIIQGPLVDPELGEKSLRLLLKKCGYDKVNVRRSKVPIRF
jgi:hypothetical protein